MLPYPLTSENPKKFFPKIYMTIYGHPNGVSVENVASNGKLKTISLVYKLFETEN